jgi:hypothetical protein
MSPRSSNFRVADNSKAIPELNTPFSRPGVLACRIADDHSFALPFGSGLFADLRTPVGYWHGLPIEGHYCVGNPENFVMKALFPLVPGVPCAVWNAPGVVGKLLELVQPVT